MVTRSFSVSVLTAAVLVLGFVWTGCSPVPEVQVPDEEVLVQEDTASDVDFVAQYLDVGKAYYDEGRYGDAIDQFRSALQINPYSDEAHASIGMAQYHLAKRSRAEASFRRALMLNPRNIVARNGIAMVSDDERERSAQLEMAVAYEPEVTELRNNLCVTLVQGRDYERAISECQESIRLDSTNAHAYYNLGYAYQQQGRLDMALSEYRNALRQQPHWARVLNNMGLVYYYKSEFGYAINYYRDAIAADDSDPTYHYNLALAYEAIASRLQTRGVNDRSEWQNLYRNAVTELNAYLRLNPAAGDADRIRSKIHDLQLRTY